MAFGLGSREKMGGNERESIIAAKRVDGNCKQREKFLFSCDVQKNYSNS